MDQIGSIIALKRYPAPPYSTAEAAWKVMADRVAAGDVRATGRPGEEYASRGQRQDLAIAARDLIPEHDRGGPGGMYLMMREGAGRNWYDVEFSRASLTGQFTGESGPRDVNRRACILYGLPGEMR